MEFMIVSLFIKNKQGEMYESNSHEKYSLL